MTINCKAQFTGPFIVPIEEQEQYVENLDNDDDAQIPDNLYYKDVNNLLDPYVGTWTGSYNTFTIEIVIEKVTTTFYGIMSDELHIGHKVLNNGIEIANTLNLPNDSPEVMKGIYFNEQGQYLVSYIYNLDCGQVGTVYIKLRNNPNEMSFFMYPTGEIDVDPSQCTGPTQILPTSGIILTRQ